MAYTLTQLQGFFTNANAGTAPTAAQSQALQGIVNSNATGSLNEAQAFQATVDLASDSTTAVSVGTYEFFLGFAPSKAGLASLNAAYVGTGSQANMNGENRFIAQSISLALQNPTAKATFSAAYGAGSIVDATKAAYNVIIGSAAATAANINVDNSVAFLTSAASIAYYTAFVKQNIPGLSAADLDLAVRAAIVGEILFQATNYNNGAGIGSYAAATTTMLKDLADDGILASDNAAGIDLFAAYGGSGVPGNTLTLTTGVDNLVGTGNNDTISAQLSAAVGGVPTATFSALDTIDGGAGTDTLILNDTAGGSDFTAAGVKVSNVENVKLASVSTATVDTSSWAGVTSLTTSTKGGVTATAAGTTAIAVNDSALGTGAVAINGGGTVGVTTASTGNGTITIGNTTAPTGAVTVNASIAGTGATTQGLITVNGGTTVAVTTGATQATVNTTTTQAAVTVNGSKTTTSVSVTEAAVVLAGATVKGIAAGAVTINDVNLNDAVKAGTIGTVSVTNAASVAFTGNSLAALNLAGTVGAVGVTSGAGASTTALALGLGKGSTGTITSNQYKTINANVTGDNTVANIAEANATALNVSGSAVLTLTSVAGLTALTTATVTGTAGLTADVSGLATVTKVDTTGTTGTSTVTISGANGVTYAGGAGSDFVTIAGALKSGTSITLGAGNDRLLGTTPLTASNSSVVDGGAGIDTVASTLINAGNGNMFKNFEVLGLGANNLDAALLTGSTITGLELGAGGGGGTFSNVTAAQSLNVTGTAAAGTTVLTFTNVGGTADAYAITFAGVGSTDVTAPNTVDASAVSVQGIENVTVNSGSFSGFTLNALDLADADARTLTVTGTQATDIAFSGAFGKSGTGNGVSKIDASALTGDLTLNTTNIVIASGGLTVSTGAGKDVLTLTTAATVSTGAGNDTVTLGGASTVDLGAGDDTVTTSTAASTITLGGGLDKVDVHNTAVATIAAPEFTTIADTFGKGDSLVFAQGATSEVFTAAAVAGVSGATTLVDALNIAISVAATTNSQITWFQYGQNTYVVEHNGAGTDLAVGDVVVKLAGLIDLSTATYAAGTNTLTL